MSEVLLSGGLGDCVVLEARLTAEERDSLEVIHWATRAASIAQPMFEASHRYRHVRHVVYPTVHPECFFTIEGVRRKHPLLPEEVLDWSIFVTFPQRRQFNGSTFLQEEHPCTLLTLPDRPYVLIQHQTPINGTTPQRQARDLDDRDWAAITDRLDEKDLLGVVVNSADADDPPMHPRILNRVGQGTLQDSIQALKRSVGYWGISSSIACLASIWHGPEALWVKTPPCETWLWLNRHRYYQTQTSFPFLFHHLTDSEPIQDTQSGLPLMFTVMRIFRGMLVGPGSLLKIEEPEYSVLVKTGQGVPWQIDL